MLNTKGLVFLTEYLKVGQRLIKVEHWDKNYKRQTLQHLILLFKSSFTSNFDFEKPLTESIKPRQR